MTIHGLDLAKQYKKENEKINVEAIDITQRPDIAEKYGIESETEGIIVECGNQSKVLTEEDLYTYDNSTYETIDITEEKLTSAIMSVTTDKIPKVYFLSGYTDFELTDSMNYLSIFLENEVNEVKTLNVISTGKIPEDCDTLVIATPSKDFDDIATNAIIDYINSGKNILWLNAAVASEQDMPNVNKILAMYGVNPFEVGIIRETDTSKMASGSPDIIIPDIEYSKITKDIYNTSGVFLINATKINVQEEEKLEELNVEKTDLLYASETSYFRTNFYIQSDAAQEGEEKGGFLVGAQFAKTVVQKNDETGEEAKTSNLVIYGENYFVSDAQLTQNSQYSAVQLGKNKDVVLNTVAFLTEKEENITARKNTGTVTYTATEFQNQIIKIIIFAVPILIVLIGIIVWQVRRRKK